MKIKGKEFELSNAAVCNAIQKLSILLDEVSDTAVGMARLEAGINHPASHRQEPIREPIQNSTVHGTSVCKDDCTTIRKGQLWNQESQENECTTIPKGTAVDSGTTTTRFTMSAPLRRKAKLWTQTPGKKQLRS